MNIYAENKQVALALWTGLLGLLRGFRSLLQASRLVDAPAYVLAAVVVLMPMSLIGQILNWALARQATWFALLIVAVAALFLLLFAAVMTNEDFLEDLPRKGIAWPSLLSVALAWLAVLVFGALSCGFERLGIVNITPSVLFTDNCASRYADFYLWHLFDSIPALRLNEAVGWKLRYSYTDPLSAWLLVAFKVLVVVSVIGSFVAFGRLRREARARARAMRDKN